MNDPERFDMERAHDVPLSLTPGAPDGDRAWMLHHGPMYTFFDMVRRRRDRELSTSFLAGLLLMQALAVVVLVAWLL